MNQNTTGYTAQHERFSQLYLERGIATRDSVRFRNRLAAYFDQHLDEQYNYVVKQRFESDTFASWLLMQLGFP